MKKLFWLILVIFQFSILNFQLVSPAFAKDNFTTSYDVTYTVRDDQSVHAIFSVVLTNTTSQYYASSYKIRLGFTNITNVKASDTDGPIIPVMTQNTNGQSIALTFNKKVVGLHSKIPFTLSFDTDEIAQKQGSIWEVNIPGITNQSDFTNFAVHVQVPSRLGDPLYSKPSQDFSSLDFTKEQLGKSGISLAFGETEYYAFTLAYHLENTQIFPIRTEIALPPKTNYQDVVIESINPKPLRVRQDDDGNWLAEYALLPSKKVTVTVSGKSQLFLFPRKEILSENMRAEYLKEQPYWEQTEEIKKLAEKLKTPVAIYDYVVNHVAYDFSRVSDENNSRLGAKEVLRNPSSAVCLEFTDLFIALARAAGIPARAIDGYAYTQNTKQRPLALKKDIMHAWPEYYDDEKQTWVMIDPTWGNTTQGIDYFYTLDFDHFAFVIKGKNSQYPIPAGGFRDVNVSFTSPFLTNQKSAITIQSNENKDKQKVNLKTIGGVFIGGFTIIVFIIAASTRYLPFSRQKR